MTEEIKNVNSNKTKLSLGMKCSDCIGFKTGPSIFDKICCERGIMSYSHACDRFIPDHFKLTKIDSNVLEDLVNIYRQTSSSQLRLLMFSLREANKIQTKTGFKFGQPVYVNLSSPSIDYLECYFEGRVVGLMQGNMLIIASHLRKSKDLISIVIHSDDVRSKSSFKKHAKFLEKEDKIFIPDELLNMSIRTNAYPETKKPKKNEYVPPTLDNAPAEWLSGYNVEKKTKTNRKRLKNNNGTITLFGSD